MARALAVVFALFWGVLFFGLVDLATAVAEDPRFRHFLLVEAGWGLLYTVLVMLPLLAWAVRPAATILLQQVLAAAAAVLVAAVAGFAPGQVLPALFLEVSAFVPALVARRSLRFPPLSLRSCHPLLAVLSLIALIGAVAYAVVVLRHAYAGVADDDTWGLAHLPMQAGFGLTIAGATVVVALAQGAGQPRWRVGTVFPALAAAGLGAFSLRWPDELASLGVTGGAAALVWAVALLVLPLVVRDRPA
ncbi:hypothetical protein SAMN05443637_101379 [Pseudonocardia thermophila]|uniref:Uncharacterized protein n=1 Tax=Pseudonocardia thermophila TaxID=1848 RepID=A0A1M6NPB1_PSETH|nr:hypothetical protein SAMN05443637_101379 [Pseudonocardia thermophila]